MQDKVTPEVWKLTTLQTKISYFSLLVRKCCAVGSFLAQRLTSSHCESKDCGLNLL